MSSAICFNLDQSKILLSGNGLSFKNKIYTEKKAKLTKTVQIFQIVQKVLLEAKFNCYHNVLKSEKKNMYITYLLSYESTNQQYNLYSEIIKGK